jgi:hypothetical protein
MSDPHERWIKRLRMTWPQGVAARQAGEGGRKTHQCRTLAGHLARFRRERDAMSSLPVLRRAFGRARGRLGSPYGPEIGMGSVETSGNLCHLERNMLLNFE